MSSIPTTWEQGRLIAGRYRLLHPLGSGGSAHVWAARDESLGRQVALKALSGSTAQGGREPERLAREARLLAALDDPRITTVFDFVETVEQDGSTHPVLVTELLDGQSLSARLKLGPLPPPEALTVCAQVARALAVAHDSGVVHRDVKPGNVMLTARGAVLLDFGISRRETDADLTGKLLLGTPASMAPEQWRGNAARPASDVYALGCLLYWCLSGHAPFHDRELPALGLAHLLADPPDLPPTGCHHAVIDETYRACMRKDPAERPTASQVIDLLDSQAQAPTVETVEPVEPVETVAHTRPPAWRRARRRPLVAAYVASVGAVLAAAIALPLTQAAGSPAGNASTSTTVSPRSATSSAASPGASGSGVSVVVAVQSPANTGGATAPESSTTPESGGKHSKHGKGGHS
jgi:eukaryotic-like serine/threonine-protein kinase